ncbi:MAG: hypothetical protein HYY30_10285 [Chloroflexi bacterium]|nr:hypothetical protein [Chloroflexota bacterium]
MSNWPQEEDSEQLVDRLEKGNGKAFLESIGQLRKIAESLDEAQRDEIAKTLSKRLWRERHPLILRGSVAALGILAAGVTARVTLEAIARAPDKYPHWVWVPSTEALLRMGWGSRFTRHFLSSMTNPEIDLHKRVTIIQSVNGMATMGQQLIRDEKLVREKIESAEPEIREAFLTLLNFARQRPEDSVIALTH